MTTNEKAREHVITLQALQSHVDQLQDQVQELDEKTDEIATMKHALQESSELLDGQEVLVPVATGIFVPARIRPEGKVYVNVGADTLVERTPTQARRMLDNQLDELASYRESLQSQKTHASKQLALAQQEAARSVQEDVR